MITINSHTRQFSVPGADLTFGVTGDSNTEVKHFTCPRYVGDNLDVTSCFVRINYRNANGETDFYLVNDVAVDGDNVTFSWLLTPKVTAYKGQIKFVLCLIGPDLKLKWHTTQGTGQVLEGLEPEHSHIESQTADVVAQLIAMVDAQTVAVEQVGAEQVASVNSATETAKTTAVNEIEAKRANSLASIPNDYTALSASVESLARGRAGAIVCEAEGTVIAVDDASNMAIQGIRIFGRSTQDGVPTPEAPVEIKSVESPTLTVAGKNLVDFVSALGDGYTNTLNGITAVLKDGVVTTSGKNEFAGWTDIVHTRDIWGVDKYVLPAGTYTTPVGLNVITTDLVLGTSKNVRGTFTQDNLFCVRGFYITYNQGETANDRIPLVMVHGTEVPTEYEPYKTVQTVETTRPLNGIPVASGGNYTDENGQQWICDEVDLERGVYVQNCFAETVTPQFDADNDRYAANLTHRANSIFTDGYGIRLLCNKLPFNRDAQKGINGIRISTYTTNYIIAYYNGENPGIITVLYPLATPIETPLCESEIAAYRSLHSNYPNTTVLNDAGAHMVVKYTADTKLYIDKKIKEALQ